MNTARDSVVAIFPSVVSAVECAAEVQRELAGRNRSLPDARKMHFRIGINLGDVMIEPDADVYGDGVNVAARLQELAEPGGICISGPVYDLVRGRLVIGFDYLGEQRVKNISSDVPVYRVMLDGREAGAPAARARTRPKEQSLGERRRRFERFALRIGVIILGLFLLNLATNPSDLWFIFAAIPLVCVVLFGRSAYTGSTTSDAGGGRRTAAADGSAVAPLACPAKPFAHAACR